MATLQEMYPSRNVIIYSFKAYFQFQFKAHFKFHFCFSFSLDNLEKYHNTEATGDLG